MTNISALTHRPWRLRHTGDGKPGYEILWKQSMFVVMDILLDWSIHDVLYLCGILAFFMQKYFASPDCLTANGIQVVAWTMNTFDEKKLPRIPGWLQLYHQQHITRLCISVLDSPYPHPTQGTTSTETTYWPHARISKYLCAVPSPGGSGGSHKQ